jgi:phosphorylcholine metabolism protein LicD
MAKEKRIVQHNVEGLEYKVRGLWEPEKEWLGKKMIKEAVAAFNRAGVPYFLDCGTLLGCIRDGKFIGIDRDIDFGICAENYKPELDEEFKKIPNSYFGARSFPVSHLKHRWYGPEDKDHWITRLGLYMKHPERTDIALGCDIYFYYLAKGKFEGRREQYHYKDGRCAPRHLLESLRTVKFYGMEVTVPEDAEAYLEVIYNRLWRMPLETLYPWRYFKDVKEGDYK